MNQTPRALPEQEQAQVPTRTMEVLALTGLVAAVLFVFLFAWLADEMREGDVSRLDVAVRGWVHGFASPAMTRAMTAVSLLGYDVLIVELLAAIAVFLRLRWRRAAGWLAITSGGALLLDVALKQAFHRVRPAPFFGDAPHSYSFPSGHALVSFCFYAVLAGLVAHRAKSMAVRVAVGIAAALVVAAIGVSRIYLGVHYPSDVLAGYLAAAVWVSTMLALDNAGKRAVLHLKARRNNRKPSAG